jgi:hypothetical protein
VTVLNTDQFRARLSAAGVDPNSAQGRVLMQPFPKFAGDTVWRMAFAPRSINQRTLQSTLLSPDDRLRILQLLKDIVTEGCVAIRSTRRKILLW